MQFLLIIWLHHIATTAQYSVSPMLWQLPPHLLMMEQSLLSLLYLLFQDLVLHSNTLLLSCSLLDEVADLGR